MDESRRVFVRGVVAIGGSYAVAKALLLQGAVPVAEASSSQNPVIDEQPPETATFKIGVPASIPYGRGHHPNFDPLTAGLEVLPQGFTISLVGDQIVLHWDGGGIAGTYQVRAFLDDGN